MAGPPPAVAAVRLAVRRALTGEASPEAGDLVLVACSGGADSLALLSAAAFEAPRCGLRCGAVVVDHGWTEDSALRSAAVADVARTLDAHPVEVVDAPSERSEDAARRARYDALEAAADRLGAHRVLLGHTLDDQAETVLLGLARGSGTRSLAGMPEKRGRFVRPMLGVRRSTARQAALAAGLSPWDDPANDDEAFARSRVRRSALPMLEQALGPGVAESLARTARLLAADAEALDDWAAVHDPGTTELDVDSLLRLPSAVRSRVIRRVLLRAGVPGGALSAAHIEAVDALVTDWHGQGPLTLPGHLLASRSCGRLIVAAESAVDSAAASDRRSP